MVGPRRSVTIVNPVPTNAGYTLLLLLHVASAVLGFGAVVLTGAQAWRARRGPSGSGADGLRRYFRPGVNWVARLLYLVPVFGFALLADSRGAFRADDGFVVSGLLLWLVAAVAAETVVWPTERRIQLAITDDWDAAAGTAELRRDCRLVAGAAAVLGGVFLAAFVLMVAKP